MDCAVAPGCDASSMLGTVTGEAQYLTFQLGSEAYGLEILRVQEIRGYSAVTPIPNTPLELRGVMNLRGTVIPVVDLRRCLGLAPIEDERGTVIIVVALGHESVGLTVDAVSDVVSLAKTAIQPPPDLFASIDGGFITGIAKLDTRLIVLLDLERALGRAQGSGALADLGATGEPAG